MAEKPQVAAFINYFLTYVNDEIIDVGYFPASADALDAGPAGLARCDGISRNFQLSDALSRTCTEAVSGSSPAGYNR